MHHRMRYALAVCTLVAFGLLAQSGSQMLAQEAAPTEAPAALTVTANQAPVQRGTEVLGRADAGARLRILKVQAPWYQVELRQGVQTIQGWIHEKYVRIDQPPAQLSDEERKQQLAEAQRLFDECEKFQDMFKWEEALAKARRAAEIRLHVLGQRNSDTIVAQHAWVACLRSTDDLKNARTLLEHLLAVQREMHGENHKDTALLLSEMAFLLEDEGKPQEALKYVERSLAAYRASLGEKHEYTLTQLSNLAWVNQFRGNYTTALELHQEGLKLRREVLGENSAGVANSLAGIAATYDAMSQVENAATYYQQSIKAYTASLGEDDPNTLSGRINYAYILWQIGKHEEAKAEFLEVLARRRKVYGNEHYQVALTLQGLGSVLDNSGQSLEAEKYLQEAVDVIRKAYGAGHVQTATFVKRLGAAQANLGRFQEAQPKFEEALKIYRDHYGDRHPDTIRALIALGEIHLHRSQPDQAQRIMEQVILLTRQVHGDVSPEMATALTKLAQVHSQAEDYRQAERVFLQALEIKRRIFGEQHQSVADARINLGSVYLSMGRAEAARQQVEAGLQICLKIYGESHPSTAFALNALGLVYKSLDRFDDAKATLQKAVDLRLRMRGTAPYVSESLINLGVTHQAVGEYAAAAGCFERAYDTDRQLLGEDSPKILSSITHLAYIYYDMERRDEALALFQKGLALSERYPDERLRQQMRIHDGLGKIYSGRPARAHFEKALEISLRLLGPDHPDTGALQHSIAATLIEEGDGAAALQMFEKAFATRQRAIGLESTAAAQTQFRLAGLYSQLGRDDEAWQNAQQSLATRLKLLGSSSPDTAESLDLVGVLLVKRGNAVEAAKYIDRARRADLQHIASVLPGLTEAEQLKFILSREYNLQRGLALAYQERNNPQIAETSAAWSLNVKARAQETLAQRTLLARTSQDPRAARLGQQLQEVRDQLAQHALEVVADNKQREAQQRFAALQQREAELTRQLGQLGLDLQRPDPWVEIADVRKRLTTDAVFVDYCRTDVYDFGTLRWQPARYLAWIIPPQGVGQIELVDLGPADDIEAAVKSARAALDDAIQQIPDQGEQVAEQQAQTALRKLSALVLQPVIAHAGNAAELVLSPDSSLWLVPWACLPLANDKYAIEQFRLTQLVSGRELVRGATSAATTNPALIMADPDFDLGADNNGADNNNSADKGRRGGLPKFVPLPGTAVEARAIVPSIEKYTSAAPQVFLKGEALEQTFKAAHSPRSLVFCTHGFFLPDQEADVDENAQLAQLQKQLTHTKALENPLLRCGLALAGANRSAPAKPDAEEDASTTGNNDGILTGLEIVGADLRGTQLVVLSACETGLGDVRNGEGVAGLRQAFQLAGAQSVVASLWQVADRETAQLMNSFFQNLAAGEPQATALRNAQLSLINARRNRYGAAHPFFWAAFTLTGHAR